MLILGAAAPKAAWAQVLSPFEQVKHAVEAQGGVEALRALKRIAIKGEVSHWDRPTFSIVWDLKNGMARTDWDGMIEKRATWPSTSIRYPKRTAAIYAANRNAADRVFGRRLGLSS